MKSRAISAQLPRLSLEEFLRRESNAVTKHEFHGGLVTMMSGSSVEHSRIATRVVSELSNLAKGSRCHVFNFDPAIWIPASKTHVELDSSIVCCKC